MLLELDGLRPTLRQVYYQLVAKGLIASSARDYDRIGDVLTRARERRDLPPNCLTDRTRRFHESDAGLCAAPWPVVARDLADLPASVADQLSRVARWYGQPVGVHVWVEKDALAGVLEPLCEELGVPLFPCRGDPSFTALHEWTAGLRVYGDSSIERPIRVHGGRLSWTEYSEAHAVVHVILYIGDHDPNGLRIPRTTLERIRAELAAQGRRVQVDLERIALTREQVDQLSPPSFAVKGTRTQEPQRSYLAEHGDQCWEADAIPPRMLLGLVRSHVDRWFDPGFAHMGHEHAAEVRQAVLERLGGAR